MSTTDSTRAVRILLLSLLLPLITACDTGACGDTDGTNVVTDGGRGNVPTTGPVYDPTDGPPQADPPGYDPTEGTAARVCGPIVTNPDAACGIVCIDEFGVELVVLCEGAGQQWECKRYPRTGPIVSELYSGVPVWCGGTAQPD